jgi:Reverse transcriptase (RNA-dependent DNA polymerase)
MILEQLDVIAAFLNAPVAREVYVRLPSGFTNDGDMVRRLNKALYGLDDAPKLWNQEFVQFMSSIGFVPSLADPCLFVHSDTGSLLVLYVDDILLACATALVLEQVLSSLSARFKVRRMGTPSTFLGVDIQYDRGAGTVFLSQAGYVGTLVKRFGVQDAFSALTPMVTDIYREMSDHQNDPHTAQPFKSLLGALIYVSVWTRPDISHAVSVLSSCFSDASDFHYQQALRVLRYLKGTSEYGVLLGGGELQDLKVFVDADWAQDVRDRKSYGGHIFKLGSSPILWSSKKIKGLPSLSSAEAEYTQLTFAIRDILWVKPLLLSFGGKLGSNLVIYEDNNAAVAILHSDQNSSKSKYMDVKMKFCCEAVKRHKFQIMYIKSENNVADMLTKPLSQQKLERMKKKVLWQTIR